MNCVELSLKSLNIKSEELGRKIYEDYTPDVIIFIARGGYLIAKSIQKILGSELIGADAVRSGNKFKELLVPILRILPEGIKNILRLIELKSCIHSKKTERNINFHKQIYFADNNKRHKFLIVDDSVDTGNSMRAVVEEIKKIYLDSEIRCAALNVWDKSKNVIETDYVIYSNTIIKTPMSKDSKEYGEFLKIYDDYLMSKSNSSSSEIGENYDFSLHGNL